VLFRQDKMIRIFLFGLLLVLLFSACRKEDDLFEGDNAQLVFSSDTVNFDTVFTSIGTATKNIRVYNPYDETVRISSIRLNGGEQSTFRINVDGSPGAIHEDVEIYPEDSIFIFIEATIDPNNELNPFVIEDFIEFNTNGSLQKVDLIAWGQNAIYFTPTSFNQNLPDFTCLTGPCSDSVPPVNITWTNELPYVIFGYLALDSADKLTIEAGTQVHFHNNGGLWVFRDATLQVNGTKENPVIFQGDRPESRFDDLPGQWDRIWINEGGQNEINYAVIKNSFIGIQAEALFLDEGPSSFGDLKITNTIIQNCSGIGLLTSLFNLQAENLLIGNCGESNVAVQGAGSYRFDHCTFANFFNRARRESPAFFVQNSLNTPLGIVVDTPSVQLRNSIVFGQNQNEFGTSIVNQGEIHLDFSDVLLKTEENTSDTTQFKRIIQNPTQDIFIDPFMGDFHLIENSPAIDRGSPVVGNQIPNDLDENPRTIDNAPDLGVYEFKPE